MIAFGRFIAKHRIVILILAFLLLIPSVLGYLGTRVNYDILTYLPRDIDTMAGQDILMDQFGKGGFAMLVTEGMGPRDISALSDQIRQVEGVADVVCYDSMSDVPKEFLPKNISEKFSSGDHEMMLVFFSGGTSEDQTLEAVQEIRRLAGKQALLGGMSAIILDTKALTEQEEPIYVGLAVVLCCAVLALTMDSLLLPVLFLLSIGIAILYNLGSNYALGQVSYITKAIAAVLQLGVTMDYSIFLWHSFSENLRLYDDKNEAMAHAIAATFSSVVGSSLTTVAGFIALCFMSFTLGLDMGLVMAKGVVLGVICCVTVLPALILTCHGAIVKTTHRWHMPDLGRISGRIVAHPAVFLILFAALLGPALYGYTHYQVYYKLDQSLPADLPSVQANQALEDDFRMGAVHMLLLDADTPASQVRSMSREMEDVEGVSYVLGVDSLTGSLFPDSFLPRSLTDSLESEDYKLLLIGSEYPTASDAVNDQISRLQAIAKRYDGSSMLIGEAPCTRDLISITDHDFAVVSAVSIGLVFLIIAVVLKSAVLPVLLVAVIEFAIFINMGIPFYTGSVLPFITSIVIGTIQLGATVDYAILMTNRYLRERTGGRSKKEAVETALASSASSILVSALGFFAATFGVGLYSDIDLISALCTLMARGALISMVVVLTVLPSALYVFDRLILATTFGGKKAGTALKSHPAGAQGTAA